MDIALKRLSRVPHLARWSGVFSSRKTGWIRPCQTSSLKYPESCSRWNSMGGLFRSWRTTSSRNLSDHNWLEQLSRSPSTDHVLELISSSDTLTASQIAAALQHLVLLTDRQLSLFPWAVLRHPPMLSVQAFSSSEMCELFQPLLRCPDFDTLCREAGARAGSFSNRDLSSATLCLLKLHVDPWNPAVRKLLLECGDRCHLFDLECLVDYGEIGNLLRRSGFVVLARAASLLDDCWSNLAASRENLELVTNLLRTVGYFFTRSSLHGFQKTLCNLLSRWRHDIRPDTVIDLLETVNRFGGPVSSSLHSLATDIAVERVDELSTWHLSRAAFLVKSSANAHLAVAIRSRISRTLDSGESLRPADQVFLFQACLHVGATPRTKIRLEQALEMAVDHFDVVLLKYFSQLVIESGIRNQCLLDRYFRCVHSQLDDLFGTVSCLMSVTHCLSKLIYRSRSLDSVFSRQLMANVTEKQLGTQLRHLASVSRYLLQCRDEFDARNFELFLKMLHQSLANFTLTDVANVGLGLSFPAGNSKTKFQVQQLVTLLADEIVKRRHEIRDISFLNLVVRSVLSKVGSSTREVVLQEAAALYRRLAPNVDFRTLKHTAQVLSALRLRVPEVLERLTAVATQDERLDTSTLAAVVEAVAQLNFRPTELDALQEVVTRHIESLPADDTGRHSEDVLVACAGLVKLQVCPDELINKVCCLQFLHRLHVNTRSTKSAYAFVRRKRVKLRLSEFNRGVLLSCVHLSLPWFCEEYSRTLHVQKIDSAFETRWKDIIRDGLTNALGGPEFVKVGPLLAPYNITYDFECVINKRNVAQPVNKSSLENGTRVALLLTTPSDFCQNDQRFLVGTAETKIIHLEILGFQVVKIPYYDLDAMMLSDRNTRTHYFKSIFRPGLK